MTLRLGAQLAAANRRLMRLEDEHQILLAGMVNISMANHDGSSAAYAHAVLTDAGWTAKSKATVSPHKPVDNLSPLR